MTDRLARSASTSFEEFAAAALEDLAAEHGTTWDTVIRGVINRA